jgi:DNA mismatch repair ATPase MutS
MFRFQILSIMALKQTLQISKHLHSTLLRNQPQAYLLQQTLRSLEDARIDWLLGEIDHLVDESVLYNKSQSQNKLQSLYLLRSGLYSLLDVARKVYTDTVDQIFRLADSYKSQLHDPKLKVLYNDTRKYHLELSDTKRNALLGDEFIQVSKHGKKTLATTSQLAALSDRAGSAASEVLGLTYGFVEELICKARGKMPCVYNAAHALAELDVMASFAAYALMTPSCRPELSSNSEFHLTASRHPLLDTSKRDITPNDLHLASVACIVTGANASGKSTLLTQTALLAIMTQAGSYIPASAAQLPILDQVFTRAGEADSLEQSSSSFLLEMKGMAYILRCATSHSLVLIDELCKGTSLEDGFALAWAVIEELANRGCIALISTHMQQLALMQGRVPGVCNLLLEGFLAREGALQAKRYGLDRAKNSALPAEIVQLAYEVYDQIEARTKLLV